jgi:hypothetical protein
MSRENVEIVRRCLEKGLESVAWSSCHRGQQLTDTEEGSNGP